MNSTEIIAAARAVLEKATPGPWDSRGQSPARYESRAQMRYVRAYVPEPNRGKDDFIGIAATYGTDRHPKHEANADLICLSVNTFAALLDVLEIAERDWTGVGVYRGLAVAAAIAALEREVKP